MKYLFYKDGTHRPMSEDGVRVVDTKYFTKTDWDRIALCDAAYKMDLAQFIEEKRGDSKK
jgi:hypothetical protein